jgi:hypothetical protein
VIAAAIPDAMLLPTDECFAKVVPEPIYDGLTCPKYALWDSIIKISRQCSILAVIFWSVTYFGVFNFGTSYLGAKIGQNKTMTER